MSLFNFKKTVIAFGMVVLPLALISCQAGKKVGQRYELAAAGKALNVKIINPEAVVSLTEMTKSVEGRPQEVPVTLPDNYTRRRFIASISDFSYDVNYLPGSIIKYDPETDDYYVISLTRFIRESEFPEIALITDQDGLIFKSIIKSSTSLSGASSCRRWGLTRARSPN